MATQNSNNTKITNLADGFNQAGGTTARKLTVTGADITLTGSGTAVHTFPSTTSTLARIDAANTFVGASTATSWVFTTPTLGVATATTVNKVTITAPATSATLTLAQGSSLITAGAFALTLTSGQATNVTIPTVASLTMARIDAAQTFTGVQTFTAPILGTPTSVTLTNATGLPIAGLVASTSTALGVGSVELGHATDTTLSRSAAGVLAVEGVTVTTEGSTTETSSATTTVAIAGTRHTHTITALAVADAIAAPTSVITLSDKNTLIIRIKDNATARALTWNAIFRASSDLALPSTTVLSKTLYVGFKYNVADTKWDLLSVLNNF